MIDAQDFAVILHYTNDAGEGAEIARIDTSHGYAHMDELFRNPMEKQPMDVSWDEAERHLQENWRDYERRFDNTHGQY